MKVLIQSALSGRRKTSVSKLPTVTPPRDSSSGTTVASEGSYALSGADPKSRNGRADACPTGDYPPSISCISVRSVSVDIQDWTLTDFIGHKVALLRTPCNIPHYCDLRRHLIIDRGRRTVN